MVWPPQSARIITSVRLGVIPGADGVRVQWWIVLWTRVRVSAGVTAWTRRLPPGCDDGAGRRDWVVA
jgi:hypothetical protein